MRMVAILCLMLVNVVSSAANEEAEARKRDATVMMGRAEKLEKCFFDVRIGCGVQWRESMYLYGLAARTFPPSEHEAIALAKAGHDRLAQRLSAPEFNVADFEDERRDSIRKRPVRNAEDTQRLRPLLAKVGVWVGIGLIAYFAWQRTRKRS